jgi:hypothetical protein
MKLEKTLKYQKNYENYQKSRIIFCFSKWALKID